MATPPTFVASYGNAAITNTAKTASVTVQAGDLVVVKAATGSSSDSVTTPTGGALTYALQQSTHGVTQQSSAYIWTAVSSSAQTFTISLSPGDSGSYFTFVAEVWRTHGGVGSTAKKTATSTTSLTLTTQSANSAITTVDADWNSVSGASRAWLTSTSAFTEDGYQTFSGELTAYFGYHANSGAVGAKTVGMSAPTGQRPSLIALEVLPATTGVTGTLAITATALSTNVPPAVRIDVNDGRSPGQASALTIVRNNPDGTQATVRTTDGAPLALSAGIGLVYDYEMPLNAPVSYSALEVSTVTSPQVTVAATVPWLVHPGIPSLSISVAMRPGTLVDETYTVRQGVFFPMGRANPVVITDGARKGASSQLVLLAQSATDLTAIKDILANTTALLLNPADSSWEFGPCYIAVGDVKVSRWTDTVIDSNRDVTLTFQVVDAPVGGSQSARTYADILSSYGSYSAVLARYRSYADLLAGP